MAVRVWISRSGLHDENESDGKLLHILVGPDDYSLIKKDAHL